ncbi:hypothetical protein [Curtobacterium sp. MCLR17_042]|uniref:hypothetical protein n=1 Tax=Curtobacterium sp. MCLR17_042 TaxID=2175626 RepID=UPI000DAA1924|nr:hypothetical protein [Curtobacterium sp. MCLR17_042]PZE28382.1 hypothetical protein DEJ02_07925 [Curtobacterium sp. MCLR17_042]
MSISLPTVFDSATIGTATPTLFLDQSAWVRLAQGARGKNVEFEELRTALESRIEGGELCIALSATNYLELWHRIDGESRRDVADVMARLSGYVTVAPIEKLIDRDLRRTLGLPEAIGSVFDVGVDHAFASPLGRLRVVAHLADEDGVEGPELDPPQDLVDVLARADPTMREWNHLAGPDRVFEMDGIEMRPEHRLGGQFAVLQHDLRVRSASGTDASLLYRSLVAQTFQMIAYNLNEDVTAGVRDRFRSAVDGVALVNHTPTLTVFTELLFRAHRNSDYSFRQHDRADVMSLAQTIPVCDAVWADKHWASIARGARLDAAYDTVVLSSPLALASWLQRL